MLDTQSRPIVATKFFIFRDPSRGFIALLVRNFAAHFDPAGTKLTVPTRESIAAARAYHDLAKLDLAAVGSDLTRPLIAAAGRQNDRVCLLDRSRMVASECQIVACDASTAMIKIDSKYFMVAPLHLAARACRSTSPQGSLPCVCRARAVRRAA